MNKFELTNETKVIGYTDLFRIVALKDFRDVKAGDKGGWVEKEENLSQDGNCWVGDFAEVTGDGRVTEDARVGGVADVGGKVAICGNYR